MVPSIADSSRGASCWLAVTHYGVPQSPVGDSKKGTDTKSRREQASPDDSKLTLPVACTEYGVRSTNSPESTRRMHYSVLDTHLSILDQR